MSKKHKKKARAAKTKPHTVKEANRRKRLRDNLKAQRASTKTKQCSKNAIVGDNVIMNDTKHQNEQSSTIEDATSQQKSPTRET